MRIRNEGSIVQIIPESNYEHEYLTVNLDTEPWQWLGKSLNLDHRAADDVINALHDVGFVITID